MDIIRNTTEPDFVATTRQDYVDANVATAAIKAGPQPVMRRVLFITFGFPPSLEMGARTCAQIARYLPLYGWQPIVLTVKDKYIEPQYLGRSDTLEKLDFAGAVVKTGKLPHPLDFYRWSKGLLSRGKLDAVDLHAADGAAAATLSKLPPGQKGRMRKVLLSLLNVPDYNSGWLLPGVIGGLRAIKRNNVQVIFSSVPYFTAHLIGYLLARLTGLPWVIHFRDPWGVAMPGGLPPGLRTRLVRALERLVVNRADRVVCVTEEHSAKFREAYPQCPADKFISVPNGFDGEEWKEIDLERANMPQNGESPAGKFVILYAGQFYADRSPMPLFRALRSLIDSGVVERERLRVDLVGWCEISVGRSVSDMISEMELQDCVNLVGPKSRTETLRRMTKAGLLLLLAEGWTSQIPGKTYEYLKAGRPILALTSQGALTNFIRSTGSGWSVDPADHQAIEAAVHECYSRWASGRPIGGPDSLTVARFDRRATTGQISELFDQLVAFK